MKTPLDCIPCLLRQATEAIQLCPNTTEGAHMAIREMLLASTTMDFSQSPPFNSGALQAQVRAITGIEDPYAEVKKRFNRMALELLPPLAEAVRTSADPFAAAVRLAIAGNVIDLGAKSGLSEEEAADTARRALDQVLHGDLEGLRNAASRASRILYLCDNAGEIVFDRILLDQLPSERLTVVVRGKAVLNDATREDASTAMISPRYEVVDNGSALPGTVLADCSESFRERFANAELILAKGQGNFETLHDCGAPLFCLFRVKCATVATHCGYPMGSHVVWHAK